MTPYDGSFAGSSIVGIELDFTVMERVFGGVGDATLEDFYVDFWSF